MTKRDLSALVVAKKEKEQQDSMLANQQSGKATLQQSGSAPELRKKTSRLSRPVAIRLGVLAKEQETSEQELVEKALLLLFEQYK